MKLNGDKKRAARIKEEEKKQLSIVAHCLPLELLLKPFQENNTTSPVISVVSLSVRAE